MNKPIDTTEGIAPLRPIGDRILVKMMEKKEKTEGGILLPEAAQENPPEGTVVAVGQGKRIGGNLVTFAEMGIKEGHIVMLAKYRYEKVTIQGEDFCVVDSEHILGVIEEDEELS